MRFQTCFPLFSFSRCESRLGSTRLLLFAGGLEDVLRQLHRHLRGALQDGLFKVAFRGLGAFGDLKTSKKDHRTSTKNIIE